MVAAELTLGRLKWFATASNFLGKAAYHSRVSSGDRNAEFDANTANSNLLIYMPILTPNAFGPCLT